MGSSKELELVADDLKRSYMAAISRLRGQHAQQVHELEMQLAKQSHASATRERNDGKLGTCKNERMGASREQDHRLDSAKAGLGNLVCFAYMDWSSAQTMQGSASHCRPVVKASCKDINTKASLVNAIMDVVPTLTFDCTAGN